MKWSDGEDHSGRLVRQEAEATGAQLQISTDAARREDDLKGILTYVNMLLVGAGEFADGQPDSLIRNAYHTFATGHLISTMFLLDRDGGLASRSPAEPPRTR